MSSERERAFLNDILEASQRIATYIDQMSYEEFLDDLKTQDAVIRNLEIIGEAARQISEPIRQKAPEIPWPSLTGMRNKLIHEYFGVNLDIVWHVVKDDLGKLVTAVNHILKS
jgi:uncharacterized protein with HEPN domain